MNNQKPVSLSRSEFSIQSDGLARDLVALDREKIRGAVIIRVDNYSDIAIELSLNGIDTNYYLESHSSTIIDRLSDFGPLFDRGPMDELFIRKIPHQPPQVPHNKPIITFTIFHLAKEDIK